MKKIVVALMALVFSASASYAALQFDGADDYILFPDSDNWAFGTNDFTLEFWMKLSNVTANNILISQGSGFSSPYWFLYNMNGYDPRGEIQFVSAPSIRGTGFSLHAIHGMSNDRWHHFAITRKTEIDSDYLAMYIDGTAIIENSLSPLGIIDNVNSTLFVGIFYREGGQPLDGQLDEFRIWDTGMTQGDVQYWMNNSPAGTNPDLLAYWNLDETEGQVVHDLTPYGNNGFLGSSSSPDGSDPVWIADQPNIIPEPCSFLLFGTGGLAAAFFRRKKT